MTFATDDSSESAGAHHSAAGTAGAPPVEVAAAVAAAAASLLSLARWLLAQPVAAMVLELQVVSARGLAQADEGAIGRNAKSDPYCLIYHNDKLHGKTYPVYNRHCPAWQKQHFQLPLSLGEERIDGRVTGAASLETCVLRIEVRDWDGPRRNATLLGEARLEGDVLARICEDASEDGESESEGEGGGAWYELRHSPLTTERQHINENAAVRLVARRRGSDEGSTLEVKVLAARHLAAADTTRDERHRVIEAASDPYALVYWNGCSWAPRHTSPTRWSRRGTICRTTHKATCSMRSATRWRRRTGMGQPRHRARASPSRCRCRSRTPMRKQLFASKCATSMTMAVRVSY